MEFVWAYRIEHGITRKQLSDESGINPKLIERAEKGQSVPSLEAVLAIFQGLGLDLTRLPRDSSGKLTVFQDHV